MSDQQALPQTDTSVQQPATEAPATQPEEPAWLPDRLKQARATAQKQLLQELGVTDPGDVKAKLAELDKLKTAQLTDQERIAKQLAELQPKADLADKLQAQFSSIVDSQFSALPEMQQAAIDSVASGDAGKRWELMQVLRAAGGAVIAAAARPANTAPAAPPPPAPTQPQTPFQRWEALQKTDPVQASIFHQLNAFAIEQSRG